MTSSTTGDERDRERISSPELERAAAFVPEVPLALEGDRSTVVWRQWLESMARDPEAALAAAIAYRDLDSEGRERWLTSLAQDALAVNAPKIALYAPLLSVESDEERRARLVLAMGDDRGSVNPRERARGFLARTKDGQSVYVLVLPLYLDFVQVLAARVKGGEFVWVRHDPISLSSAAPRAYQILDGVRLESHPVKAVLDDLAMIVLSHERSGRPLPEALLVLVDLLGELGP